MGKLKGGIQRRGERSWRIRYTNADGIRQAETIKGTQEDAEKELLSRLNDIAKGLEVTSRHSTVLFGSLMKDVLTDYKLNKFRSHDDIEARFRRHIEPVFGPRRAAQITTAQIKAYIVTRRDEGAKPGTINRELEAIRHTFRLALQGRRILAMPHIPMLREDNVRTGFFTRAEVARLCEFLEAPLDSFVWFAFLTGWRLEEIRGLKWTNIDFRRGEIRLDAGTTKNREGRVFPMSSELRGLLETVAAAQVAPKGDAERTDVLAPSVPTIAPAHVFTIDGKPIGLFRKSWATANKKAGFPYTAITETVTIKRGKHKGETRTRVRRIVAHRIFHDLRRSCAKELIASGIPERVVMQMCGWKTRSVFDRYSIVGEADMRLARERMDDRRQSS